jgi:hypothetical protein
MQEEEAGEPVVVLAGETVQVAGRVTKEQQDNQRKDRRTVPKEGAVITPAKATVRRKEVTQGKQNGKRNYERHFQDNEC